MAKIRAYIRVARGRRTNVVLASSRPNIEPIKRQNSYGGGHTFMPTVAFAVDFEVPDELFKSAERVIGQINVALKNAEVAADVVVPSLKKKTGK